jgi:D-alanyl-D-alanine carboxypeptidase/D-alanyl-D-alanine-endopeptidase (penicillin-binding protein 4)
VAEGVAPAAHAAIASVDSPPLATIAGEMLRQSDNLAAELLVKELGKRFGGGGTTSAGVAIVRETVAGAGVEPFALSAVDGSGLDVSDRTTCATLAALLRRAGDSSALARDLPVAARDGTLARRFVGTPVAGRLQAKTGSLAGVAGLSGWATTTQGQRLVFSLLVNGLPRDAAGQALEDRVATALVTVGPLHTADELAP